MFDLVIRDAEVVDGTGAARHPSDIGVRDGRIAALGKLAEAEAQQVIAAAGRVVAPGFIDVHAHSEGWLLHHPHLLPKTTQGFTTEVLMADGISYAPVDERTARPWIYYLRSLNGLTFRDYDGWQTLDDFAARLDGRIVQNFLLHVPYANVRSLACGFGRRQVDDFQLRAIRRQVAEAVEAGAVGLSTGLDYVEQCWASTDELVAAAAEVGRRGGLYVTHIRYKLGLLAALDEAVEIGRRAGVAVHVSHLKAGSADELERLLEYLDRVAGRHVDFSFDVYPYQASSTMLNFLLPYDVWRHGPLAALSRLARPALRRRFAAGLADAALPLDEIRIAWLASSDNRPLVGMSLAEFVEQSGRRAADALCDLLIEENLAVLLVFGDDRGDELVHPLLRHERFMLGTDGIYFPEGRTHPRMFGSAARLLGPLVRDHKLLSLEDAVHRLTGRPARRFGVAERGEIREGYWADLVVFDPESVADRATFASPHELSAGIDQVLVGGVPVIRNAAPVPFPPAARLPGRWLRAAHSPG